MVNVYVDRKCTCFWKGGKKTKIDEAKAREIWKCEDQESTQRPDSDVAEKEWRGHCKWTTDEMLDSTGLNVSVKSVRKVQRDQGFEAKSAGRTWG